MAQAPVQIEDYLKNVDFPARRDEILKQARGNDAPKEVLDGLQRLPDREYRNADQVNQEMGSVQSAAMKGGTGGTQAGARSGGGETGRAESTRTGQDIGKKTP